MKWITLGTRLIPYIVMAVQAVEQLATTKKSQEKQDAAVDILGAGLGALEVGLDRELLDNDDVQDALRTTINAVVKLQNVVAQARAVGKK
jgi:hypothetical protein